MKKNYCKKRTELKDDPKESRKRNNNLGMTTVEVILIVVLVGLVLIFKTQIRQLVETIFAKIAADSAAVLA